MATPSLFPLFLKAQSGGGGVPPDLSGATIIAADDVEVFILSEYTAEVEQEVTAQAEPGEITAVVEGEVEAEVDC
jgi:hypothetical protein